MTFRQTSEVIEFLCMHLVIGACNSHSSSRHLQIVAGMERFEYVVVYWVLITEIEAILKKKVPKIATGSF